MMMREIRKKLARKKSSRFKKKIKYQNEEKVQFGQTRQRPTTPQVNRLEKKTLSDFASTSFRGDFNEKFGTEDRF